MKKTPFKLNYKKLFMLVITPLLFLPLATYAYGAMTEQIDSGVDVKAFIEQNEGFYSHLIVKEVPTYETKDRKTQKMTVIADFGTYYKGGSQHLVQCKNDKKTCNTKASRKLTLLDNKDSKSAKYYKRILDEAKKERHQ